MMTELSEYLESLPIEEFDAEEIIVEQGRDPSVVGYIHDGIVKGVCHPSFGPIERAVLNVLGEGHWLGMESLATRFNIEYIAIAPARISLIPSDILDQDPPPALLKTLAHQASFQLSRNLTLSYLNKLSLRKRVLSRLCDLREATALHEIQITREELASLVGVHRNKVGEVLKDLEQEGLVECRYKEIMIGERQRLLEAFRGIG